MPKILRDTEKGCGKPGCPNDIHDHVVSCGDEANKGVTSAFGTYRTCRATLTMSADEGKADLALARQDFSV